MNMLSISIATIGLAPLLSARPSAAQPTPYALKEPLGIRSAVPNRATIPRYGKFELRLDIAATFDNPFDPDDVDVWAELTSPSGRHVRVDAYFDQSLRRKLDAGREIVEPAGEPHWTLRYSPDEVGRWTYRIHAKDRSGSRQGPAAAFTVVRSSSPGFVVRSSRCPRLFARSNGAPFMPVGLNMAWGGARGSFDFDDWLPALAKAGGNWIRLWMVSWNCALEWTAENKGDWRSGTYHGLGVYSLDNAWKLDTILDAADRNGVSAMLCLGTFGEFTEGGYFNEGQWKANPYNAANGGPCKTPADFWTNEDARKLYRRRLRYIAARYGWRTNLMAWEFWNEVPPHPAWLAEMARYLKGSGEFAGRPADPLRHLVSTSYGNEAVWRIPEIDFSMTHHYGSGDRPDHAPIVAEDAERSAGFGKPHLMAEFGADYRKPDTEYDPNGRGINLHNGLWASIAAGNAGTAMIWWWDNYVHPKNLWHVFGPVRLFVDAIPWTSAPWAPVALGEAAAHQNPEALHDMSYPASGEWAKAGATAFTLEPGGVRGSAALPGFLFSPGKPDLRTTPTFWVRYAIPGRFLVHVNSVCASATLRFRVDGEVVKDFHFDAAPVPAGQTPEYKNTELLKQYNCYQARYDKDYGIDVPAGSHSIKLDVTEGDWLGVDEYRLTNYRASRMPDLEIRGQSNGTTAFLWLHNPRHNWKRVLAGDPIPPVPASTISIRNLPDGRYAVQWWDAWEIRPPTVEHALVRAGHLVLKVPAIATDMAVVVAPSKAASVAVGKSSSATRQSK